MRQGLVALIAAENLPSMECPRRIAPASLLIRTIILDRLLEVSRALDRSCLAEWEKGIRVVHCRIAPRVALYASKGPG